MNTTEGLKLGEVVDALFASGISCSVAACFWEDGLTVKLGDEMNGFSAEKECANTRESAEFLDTAARKHFPESIYVLGIKEWERRNPTHDKEADRAMKRAIRHLAKQQGSDR